MSQESEAKDQQLVNLHKERAQWEAQRVALEEERDAAKAAAAQGGDISSYGGAAKGRQLQELNAKSAELERIRAEAVAKVDTHVREARSLAARDRDRSGQKDREDKAKLGDKRGNEYSADSAQRDGIIKPQAVVDAQLRGGQQVRKSQEAADTTQKKREEVEGPRGRTVQAEVAGNDRQSKPRGVSGSGARGESSTGQAALPTGADAAGGKGKGQGPVPEARATLQQ